jgi:hypothetical protein
MQDLRYGARQLRLNPGFAAVAVLSLAHLIDDDRYTGYRNHCAERRGGAIGRDHERDRA